MIKFYKSGKGMMMILSFLMFSSIVTSCKEEETAEPLSTDAEITSFAIQGMEVGFTVDQSAKTITNEQGLPFGTDISNLVAEFDVPEGAAVSVGGTKQVSGSTANDFSGPVEYVVTAEDATTSEVYMVTINTNSSAWNQLTENGGFAKFSYFNAVYFKEMFWITGLIQPQANGEYFSKVYNSEDGATWEEAGTSPDSIVAQYAGAVVYNDMLYMMGGYLPTVVEPEFKFGEAVYNVVSSSDGINWQEVIDTADFAPLAAPNLFAFKEKIWMVGGNGIGFGTIQSARSSNVYSSSDGAVWDQMNAEDVFPPRSFPGTVVFEDKMWVLGGMSLQYPTDDPADYSGDVYSSADGITWTQETADGFPKRAGSAVFEYKGKLYMIGGVSANEANEVIYHQDLWVSEDGKTWTEATGGLLMPEGFGGRAFHRVVVKGDKIYVFGGASAEGNFNDVWVGEFSNE